MADPDDRLVRAGWHQQVVAVTTHLERGCFPADDARVKVPDRVGVLDRQVLPPNRADRGCLGVSHFRSPAAAGEAPDGEWNSAALKSTRNVPNGWPRHCGRNPNRTTCPLEPDVERCRLAVQKLLTEQVTDSSGDPALDTRRDRPEPVELRGTPGSRRRTPQRGAASRHNLDGVAGLQNAPLAKKSCR